MKIDGVAAVVTGGASGLGLATARALAGRGARVGIIDLPTADGEAAAASVGTGAGFFPADVTSAEGLDAAIDAVVSACGPLRIAVACAGVAPVARILARDGTPMALEAFNRTIAVNLSGSFNLLRLAAARMAAREPEPPDGERGVVILTASVAAYEGQVGQAAYAASKGGIVALTITAARDLAVVGVRVATIAPGTFDTPMLAGLPAEAMQRLAAQIPHPKRLGRPEEYGALAVHIVENAMLNGEVIRLDGALRMPPK